MLRNLVVALLSIGLVAYGYDAEHPAAPYASCCVPEQYTVQMYVSGGSAMTREVYGGDATSSYGFGGLSDYLEFAAVDVVNDRMFITNGQTSTLMLWSDPKGETVIYAYGGGMCNAFITPGTPEVTTSVALYGCLDVSKWSFLSTQTVGDVETATFQSGHTSEYSSSGAVITHMDQVTYTATKECTPVILTSSHDSTVFFQTETSSGSSEDVTYDSTVDVEVIYLNYTTGAPDASHFDIPSYCNKVYTSTQQSYYSSSYISDNEEEDKEAPKSLRFKPQGDETLEEAQERNSKALEQAVEFVLHDQVHPPQITALRFATTLHDVAQKTLSSENLI